MKTKNFLLFFLFIYNFAALGAQIQYAKVKATNELVNADSVERIKGPFTCLECAEDLILRRGEIKQAHFAHKASTNNACGGGLETYEHLLAKQLLVEHLDKWEFRCFCISKNCPNQLPPSGPFLADKGYKAQKEYAYDKYRVDVMVFKNNIENLALEVRHTHAVEDEKREFFNACNLNMIEVDAKQIIEAHEEASFIAKVIKPWRCKECEEHAKRPCLDCKNRLSLKYLDKIAAPVGHKYPSAFVCQKCKISCPVCKKLMSKGELAKHKSCVLCNQNIEEWQAQFDQAINKQNLTTMRSLIKKAPPSLNRENLEIKCKEVEQELETAKIEQHERSLALEKQRKEDMIEQWKNQTLQAINSKNCDEMRKLQKTVPLNVNLEEECELIKKELAVCEIEEEKIIEQRAKQIVATRKVYFNVPYGKKPLYGTPYMGDTSWVASIENINACAPWLKYSEKLIPRVQALLKEQPVKNLSNKRKSTKKINPPPKKQSSAKYFVHRN